MEDRSKWDARRLWRKFSKRLRRHPFSTVLCLLLFYLFESLFFNILSLWIFSRQQADAVLVIGGNPDSEIYAAQLHKCNPDIPILISGGQPEPCEWKLFQKVGAPTKNVWLEEEADNTFGNFYWAVPVLRQWNVRRVKVVDGESHLPRVTMLARILLGAKGIQSEFDILDDNDGRCRAETEIKTELDVTRSLAWAVASQIFEPRSTKLVALSAVDMKYWAQKGCACHPLYDINDIRLLRQER